MSKIDRMNIANIHSIETCGTVDGPGIRFVIFFQGCPLRCKYCHNPDTWKMGDGEQITVDDLVKDILKYRSYMKFSGGGVTVTGGEPLLQVDFLIELFTRLKKHGVHTAIDTSGYVFNEKVAKLLDLTDLVLLDIKHFDKQQYRKITGVPLDPTLEFMHYLQSIHKPMWIRYVLVPTLSDQEESLESLSKYLSQFTNIDKIELLPFHKMGEYKWKELGVPYELSTIKEPTKEEVFKAMAILKMHNMNVTLS